MTKVKTEATLPHVGNLVFALPAIKTKEEVLIEEIFNFEENSPDELQYTIEDQQVRKVVTALEAKFWTDQITQDYLLAVLHRYQVPSYSRDDVVKQAQSALSKRGIEINLVQLLKGVKGYDDELHPMFVIAVNQILTTHDKRTLNAKLKALGISPQKWEAFLRNPAHRAYFDKNVKRVFGDTDFYAQIQLTNLVQTGDLQAIKYYNEVVGKYRPDSESSTRDFLKVIMQLMEILARKLTPDVLDVISREFDEVLQKELGSA